MCRFGPVHYHFRGRQKNNHSFTCRKTIDQLSNAKDPANRRAGCNIPNQIMMVISISQLDFKPIEDGFSSISPERCMSHLVLESAFILFYIKKPCMQVLI